jgi:hypothetical protein
VLDELAGWHGFYETPVGRQLIQAMVTHDVNHPSVVFWDNGNEQNPFNNEVDDEFGKWDPQNRTVLHPWRMINNVDTHHYPTYNDVKNLAAAPNVVMPTEFLHGLFDGGMGAGLDEYWEVMRNSKVFAGGFLWSYVDETVKRKDQDGKMDSAGNQAPDGVLGPYREKEGSFYTVKQVWSPIVLKRDGNNLTIENRYDFTNANQCKFTVQLRNFNSPSDPKAGFSVVSESRLPVPSIPPHESKVLVNDLAENTRAEALAIRVDDPNGRELWTYVWPLVSPQFMDRSTASRAGAGNAMATENADSIDVVAGDLTAKFDKTSGYLSSVTRGGKTFTLTNGPRMTVGESKLEKIEHRSDGADQIVETTYSGDMQGTRWRVKPDGWLELEYAYSLTGKHDFFGVSFDLPESDVKSMRWLGNGPFHVWKNRLAGGTLGVWENSYNNTITGYEGWVYPEFKGYYSDVRWMKVQTAQGPILVTLDDPKLFVQMLKVQFPGDPKPGQNTGQILSGNAWTTFPDAGFSILHAIPPIGSKFKGADSTGPAGQTPIAEGNYRGSARFYFGEAVSK